jgi:hypothetical protein
MPKALPICEHLSKHKLTNPNNYENIITMKIGQKVSYSLHSAGRSESGAESERKDGVDLCLDGVPIRVRMLFRELCYKLVAANICTRIIAGSIWRTLGDVVKR